MSLRVNFTDLAHDLLEGWAQWAREGNAEVRRLGYTSPAARLLTDRIHQDRRRYAQPLNDDWALKVDRAVAMLCRRDVVMGEAVLLWFLQRRSYESISDQLDLGGRKKAATAIDCGVAWIDAVLTSELQDKGAA